MILGRTCGRAATRRVIVAGVLAAAGTAPLAVRGTQPVVAATPAGVSSFACPSEGPTLPAGALLQPALDAAAPDAVLCLAPGRYRGPITLHAPVTLAGPADAVIESDGQGTTVHVTAPGVRLRGFTIDGSGDRFDTTDAALAIHADDAVAAGLTIRRALFGIIAERAEDVLLEGNRITGDAAAPEGLRGDGIRFWEVRRGRILGNRIEAVRDVAVWYSPGSLLAGNVVDGSRYAAHFMYSSDSAVRDNRYERNVVGLFIMYSRGIRVEDNVIRENTSAESMGLGAKDSGDITIARNVFAHVGQCLYIDNSPFGERETVVVRGNDLTACTAGITFHRSETRTTIADNRFEGNDVSAAVEGRGTARGVLWQGNYFDDYRGYDLDRDGYGDVPYASRDLSARLIARRPVLALFRGTLALGLLDLAAETFPVLQPETLLVDARPRMSPPSRPAAAVDGGPRAD